jgi:hypothetical protein
MFMMNIYHPPAEGNFCHGHRNTLKSAIEQDYSKQTGHMDKCHHITNTYSISRLTMKCMKKLSFTPGPFNSEQFHPPDLLWFKMNAQIFQTYVGQGTNTMCVCMHTLTLDHTKTKIVPPANPVWLHR